MNYPFRTRSAALTAALVLSLCFGRMAFATPSLPPGMPLGGCWSDPLNTLTIKMSIGSTIANTPGYNTLWSTELNPRQYSVWCAFDGRKNNYLRIRVESSAPRSEISPGYFKLTDEVDFNILLHTGGVGLRIPFYTDYGWINNSNIGSVKNGISEVNNMNDFIKAKVNIKPRRTIIGGAYIIPSGLKLARGYIFSNYTNSSPKPAFTLVTEYSVQAVSSECKINNGTTIAVPFGLIDSSLLTAAATSSPYKTSRSLSYKCGTSLTQDISVNLAADSAGFADAIKTTNPDIGVVMQYQNQTVKPGGGFKTRLLNGQGSDNVTFAVVGSGKTPATGPFTGSATLIISSL